MTANPVARTSTAWHAWLAWLALVATAAVTSGCVKAPNISVVDSKTALERQAAGDYEPLENDLANEGISPRPEVIGREELTSGDDDDEALGEVAQLFASAQADSDWIDQMLVEGCIGESTAGLLEPTPARCDIRVDEAERVRILGRANLHRRQVWRYLAAKRPGASPDAIRKAWREVHLEQVVCGGLVQLANGDWEPKTCN